jgi:hypothetical protein
MVVAETKVKIQVGKVIRNGTAPICRLGDGECLQ